MSGSKREGEIGVRCDIDVIDVENRSRFVHRNIGRARNYRRFILGRIESLTAVGYRSAVAGISNGLLIERTAAGPTFELVHIRPVAIDFLDLRAAVLAVKSVTRRNIAVALYDLIVASSVSGKPSTVELAVRTRIALRSPEA